MALTTVEEVLKVGGLDEALDYNLFRLNSEAELRERVLAEMAVAAAYVELKVPTFYVSTDVGIQTLLARAEAYITLQQLAEPLKSRKIYGSHYPIDTEESPRFQALIDTEWEAQAMRFLNLFGADESRQPIMLPGLVVGGELSTSAQTPETRQGLLLDEVRGLLNNPNWILP